MKHPTPKFYICPLFDYIIIIHPYMLEFILYYFFVPMKISPLVYISFSSRKVSFFHSVLRAPIGKLLKSFIWFMYVVLNIPYELHLASRSNWSSTVIGSCLCNIEKRVFQ